MEPTLHTGHPLTAGRDQRIRSPDRGIANARAITRWLDDMFVDPIVGFLVPGAGDLVSSGLGLYMIALAARKRLPAIVLARMFLNLSIDAAIGAIPIIGDAFDVLFKAHRRNLRLLEERGPGRSAPGDWLFVGGAALLFVLALATPLILLIVLLRRIF